MEWLDERDQRTPEELNNGCRWRIWGRQTGSTHLAGNQNVKWTCLSDRAKFTWRTLPVTTFLFMAYIESWCIASVFPSQCFSRSSYLVICAIVHFICLSWHLLQVRSPWTSCLENMLRHTKKCRCEINSCVPAQFISSAVRFMTFWVHAVLTAKQQ